MRTQTDKNDKGQGRAKPPRSSAFPLEKPGCQSGCEGPLSNSAMVVQILHLSAKLGEKKVGKVRGTPNAQCVLQTWLVVKLGKL